VWFLLADAKPEKKSRKRKLTAPDGPKRPKIISSSSSPKKPKSPAKKGKKRNPWSDSEGSDADNSDQSDMDASFTNVIEREKAPRRAAGLVLIFSFLTNEHNYWYSIAILFNAGLFGNI